MPPTSSTRSKARPIRGRQGKPRGVVEAFGRYFDKVEWRNIAGHVALVTTCSRCRVVEVIAWPDNADYVRGCLNDAHQNHNHR